MKICIRINEQEIAATLIDIATFMDFSSLLPFYLNL